MQSGLQKLETILAKLILSNRLSHATECWKNLGENGDFRDAGRVSRTITTPPENENGVCEDRNLQKAIYSITFDALNPENQRMIVNY